MKAALFLAVTITVTTATPSGYYHQEYNYKTSAASYRNNELQHKTDDQGYYSKDGDLEGRVKPKVSANSEHSEYVNPKLQTGQSSAGYYDSGADLTSHGNMLANSYGGSVGGHVATGYHSGSEYENSLLSEGVASSSDLIGAASGYSAGSYSAGSESSYESANLRSIASRLQTDLQHELQSAIATQSQRADIAELEEELRRNITMRLQDLLQERFGAQAIRGGQSYSLTEGRLQTRPNYDQRALEQLQRQVERSLLEELRQDYNFRTMSHSSHQASVNQHHRYEVTTTTFRPTYNPIYPNLNSVIGPQEKYPSYGVGKDSRYSQYDMHRASSSSNVEYRQDPNAMSITTIASNVQRDLNEQLNRLLEDAQRRYFTDSSLETAVSSVAIVDRMKQDVRQNLTYALDEELRRNFGTQVQRNGYMFSMGSGEANHQYNYKVADLENLRRQVEENLIAKLSRDFEAARQHWITRQQQRSSQTMYGQDNYRYEPQSANNLRYELSTPRYYLTDDYHRPTSPSIVPLISSGVKGRQYSSSMSGSQHTNYESSGGNVAALQTQLQADLTRQLQAALTQNRAHLGGSRYSATGEGHAAFEDAYRRLYDELQRNLTQQLQSFEAGSSGYSSSYGGGVSESQLAQMRSQLQRNLASQLQQGLQQSYSASASYSASSGSSASAGAGAYSSSNSGGGYYNRAARGGLGSDNYQYGQYRAGLQSYAMEGADCQGDDPLTITHQSHRLKRSYGYRSRPLGLSTQTGVGYNAGGTYGGFSTQAGQQEDGTDTVHGQQNIGQEIDDTDDTQQIVVDPGFDIGHNARYRGQISLGQEEDHSDDTQQIEVDHGFGSIGLGSQTLQSEANQRPLYSSTLQRESGGYQRTYRLNSLSVYREDGTQHVQEVDHGFGSTGIGSSNYLESGKHGQSSQRPLYSSMLRGTSAYPRTSRPSSGSVVGQSSSLESELSVGQEQDSSDTQQTERNTFGNIEVGSQSVFQREFPPKQDSTRTEQSGRVDNTNIDRGIYSTHSRRYNYQSAYGGRVYSPEYDSDDTQQVEVSGNFDIPSFSQTTASSRRPSQFGNEVTTPKTLTQFGHQSNAFVSAGVQLGQEVDDSDTLQQTEPNWFSSTTKPNQFDVNWKRFDTYSKPSLSIGNVQSPFTTPRRSLSLEFGSQNVLPESSTFQNFQHGNQPLATSSASTGDRRNNLATELPSAVSQEPNKPNQFDVNWKRFDTSPRPSLSSGNVLSTTPRNGLSLQFGSQNVLPEFESVQPLPESSDFQNVQPGNLPLATSSGRTDDRRSNLATERPSGSQRPDDVNVGSITRPITANDLGVSFESGSWQQIDIPSVQLNDISKEIQANLTSQIEDIVRNVLPSSRVPDQLYKDTLYDLRENVTRECKKILEDRRYTDLDARRLEKYIEMNLRSIVEDKFRASGYLRGDSLLNTYYPNRPNTGYDTSKPHIAANTFLQREIDSQHTYGYASPISRPAVVESDPLSDSRSTPTVSSLDLQFPQSSSRSTLDDDKRSFSDEEERGYLLIQRLRDSLRNRPKQKIENIELKLENMTAAQLIVIRQIEDDINQDIEDALRIRVSSLKQTNDYQQALQKLEVEFKEQITKSVHELCEPGLSQNSDLILKHFDNSQIRDVERYLEIRLFNRLRDNIQYYSSIGNSQVSFQHSSSVHYANSDQQLHNYGVSNQGGVKGARHSTELHMETPRVEAAYVSHNSNSDVELLPAVSSDLSSTESTTPAASWWKRFSNKVKQGANSLKEKIVGAS